MYPLQVCRSKFLKGVQFNQKHLSGFYKNDFTSRILFVVIIFWNIFRMLHYAGATRETIATNSELKIGHAHKRPAQSKLSDVRRETAAGMSTGLGFI